MWKKEYSRFEGLTKEIHDEYRYDLARSGYWICDEDEDGFRTLEILYLDSDDGCILFSSENEIFEEEGMQIKLIDCQWVDIRSRVLIEITELMNKFVADRQKKYELLALSALK
tara:strand:+ start:276 stop:614 length:339 start_codon:yes stop_codon:yes gene_type:complete